MKIMMLIDLFSVGGAESHLLSLSSELAKRGHNVVVVSAGGKMVKNLREVGVKHHRIPNISSNLFNDVVNSEHFVKSSSRDAEGYKPCLLTRFLVAREVIFSLAKRYRPDVIHAHTRRTAFLARGVCRRLKIPLIVTAHAHFPMNFPKNHVSYWGDMTIAVSEDIKEHLVASGGVIEKRIRVIVNGV